MFLIRPFISLVLLAVSGAIAAKHGTIGYGIDMFHPWCCTACSDVLAALYLECTTFSQSSGDDGMSMKLRRRMDMDMEMTGTTSSECYANNTPFQQTLSYCVKTHCDDEGVSYAKQNTCFQKLAAGGLPVPSLQLSLPAAAPTEELAEDAMWLNYTMLVNRASWSADRGTIEVFEESEEYHVRFSITVMTISIGAPLLTGLAAFFRHKYNYSLRTSRLAAFFQSQFALPALIGQRHSQSLPYNIGYVPKRAMTSLIAIYVILNIVFSAIPYRSVQPNSWFSNRNSEMAAYVANRTGVLSFANMALAILFSTRNNPLAYLSGWSHTSFLTLHRWASRVAILQAVVHSIVYTVDYCYYKGSNSYATEAAMPYFWWGIIATTAMGLMAGLSALPLRQYCYEAFLITHIVLAILSLLGSWYHVDIRFTKNWGYEVWLYIAFAFWSYDRLVRLLKVVYYSFRQELSAVATLVPGTDIVALRIYSNTAFPCKPGRHTFLYFPSLGKFWENHPFTIADWSVDLSAQHSATKPQLPSVKHKDIKPQEKTTTTVNEVRAAPEPQDENSRTYMQCYIRVHNGATANLQSVLATGGATNVAVLTEGLYGGHAAAYQSLKEADKILCIAGGIGITWSAGFAKQFSLEQFKRSQGKGLMMPKAQRFVLAWSVREEGLLTHVQQHVLPKLADNGLDDGSMSYRFWLTGEDHERQDDSCESESEEKAPEVEDEEQLVSVTVGRRMDVQALVSSFMESGKRHVILICGPGGLADQVRSETVACSRQGFFVDLIEEPFAW